MAPSPKAAGGPARPTQCRCGHFPVAHMRVLPLEPAGLGNYRLEPSGSCSICGSEVCPRFRPTGPADSPS